MCVNANLDQSRALMIKHYIYLLLFSCLFILLPKRILLLLVGGMLLLPVAYFLFFYFYNPFITGDRSLYVHPAGLYRFQHPSSWRASKRQNGIIETVYFGKIFDEKDRYKWNYADNSVDISRYSQEGFSHKTDTAPRGCEKRSELKIGNHQAEVFYCRDWGSSFSASFVLIRISTDEDLYEIEICRVWNDEGIINPHAISPERLLKKALPILETLKIGQGDKG